MKNFKNLVWLTVVSLGTAWFMVWKNKHSDQMSMDLLYVQYKALAVGLVALLAGLAALNWNGFSTGAHRVWVIGKKELFGYFSSPLGYVILFDYLIIVGFVFYLFIKNPGASVDIYKGERGYSFWLFFVSMLTVPMITMRLFAEERATGTLEMLVTSPITEVQIVLGKFLAAVVFYAVTLAPTLFQVWELRHYAAPAVPEMGVIYGAYIGVFLMGVLFLAIGTLISALTKHQVVAGMVTLHVLLVLWILLGGLTWQEWDAPKDSFKMALYNALKYVQFESQLSPFQKGLIDSRGLIYVATTVIFLLFLTAKTLEVRRWK